MAALLVARSDCTDETRERSNAAAATAHRIDSKMRQMTLNKLVPSNHAEMLAS